MNSLTLVIFGITSNLAQLKLIPALYDMAESQLLAENFSIIGISRTPQTSDEFKNYFQKILHLKNRHHPHEIKEEVVQKLLKRLIFLDGHLDDSSFYPKLKQTLDKNPGNRIYYLATYPNLYQSIFENLQTSGLNSQKNGFVRLMIEKPIGMDLQSAQALNSSLLKYFSDDQIYRLDHYLGKETLQSILTFRFSNPIFETLMNKDFIDHIQITASEDFGIGERGGYYDSVGALRDVGQNHILQMIAFATMDKPEKFANKEVTAKRLEILNCLKPFPERIVFGQYEGYKNEKNVKENSQTDTFFAFKTKIDNDKWKNVPIYVRAGKRLKQTITEISIVFKGGKPNVLIYRIQPNEGIVLKIMTKKPGQKLEIEENYMQFCYKFLGDYLPDPYERLISDTIRGDQTFFNDADEVEAQWKFIDPLYTSRSPITSYHPGSWGPKTADELIKADGREWLEPSNQFCTF